MTQAKQANRLCYRSYEMASDKASELSQEGEVYHVLPRDDGIAGFEVVDNTSRTNEMPLVSYRYGVVIPIDYPSF